MSLSQWFLIIKDTFGIFNGDASRVNILDYVTLVLITSSSSNSWFKLIWLHQRKQIKLIQTIFYHICLETRLLILNNHFLLFLLWASPLCVSICRFVIQGRELMVFSSSHVWGLVFRSAWPVPLVCHLPSWVTWKCGKWVTWQRDKLGHSQTFGDWALSQLPGNFPVE